MNISKLLCTFFRYRLHQIDRYKSHSKEIQTKQLKQLLSFASETEWGKKYGYAKIDSYTEFSSAVPLQTYEDVKGYIDRMHNGEQNVLWPTEVKYFAKSSGTTNDKSKYIPVSDEALKTCHYKGGADAVALYSRMNPNNHFFSGKGLILGGSHSGKNSANGYLTGDLSAILLENAFPLVNFLRVPSKKVALMSEWESKIQAIIDGTEHVNVTSLSGVPSWFLTLIKNMLQKTGKNNLQEIWPNLEVFFHGGIGFGPYREDYKTLIPNDKMYYVETYNASEGFFGIQNDQLDSSMLLMIDLGIFFEFIPMTVFGTEEQYTVPLWEVETDKNYALVISTNSGLWRYIIGDTVKFTRKDPYKFVITGRTKHYINTFGEEVIVDNAEKALLKATEATGAIVKEYTAAPVYMSAHSKGRHQWLIEFSKKPESIAQFAEILDNSLQDINSDYEAKRYKDLTLLQLDIVEAKANLFDEWLKKEGKLGGQHKVPRLSNDRKIIEKILALNQ
ncbi:MAG: GH3 auxin-responsive promoter family protein [Bacteroidales bacterium]|nr:GH3 auxin-responsive promoter family protein [Bacteroidales bacterium]